jgi:hypothetical protein
MFISKFGVDYFNVIQYILQYTNMHVHKILSVMVRELTLLLHNQYR